MPDAHRPLRAILATASLLLFAACGSSTGDRALGGAAIGAGAGAATSAATGGNALSGAILGGAVGATVGAVTDRDEIDLGKPIWRR